MIISVGNSQFLWKNGMGIGVPQCSGDIRVAKESPGFAMLRRATDGRYRARTLKRPSGSFNLSGLPDSSVMVGYLDQ